MPSIKSVLDVLIITVLASVYVAALTVGSISRYAYGLGRRFIHGVIGLISDQDSSVIGLSVDSRSTFDSERVPALPVRSDRSDPLSEPRTEQGGRESRKLR